MVVVSRADSSVPRPWIQSPVLQKQANKARTQARKGTRREEGGEVFEAASPWLKMGSRHRRCQAAAAVSRPQSRYRTCHSCEWWEADVPSCREKPFWNMELGAQTPCPFCSPSKQIKERKLHQVMTSLEDLTTTGWNQSRVLRICVILTEKK